MMTINEKLNKLIEISPQDTAVRIRLIFLRDNKNSYTTEKLGWAISDILWEELPTDAAQLQPWQMKAINIWSDKEIFSGY